MALPYWCVRWSAFPILAARVVSRGLRFSACAWTPYSWRKNINNFAKIVVVVVVIYLEQDDIEVEQDDSEVEQDDSEVEQDDNEVEQDDSEEEQDESEVEQDDSEGSRQ
jgi:hypothetical protein